MNTFKMKYPIVQRYLTGPSQRRPSIPLETCKFIVAHDTGNPGSTAAGNVSYYESSRNKMSASAQIFVDDVEIIECIPFLTSAPEKAWHVVYNTPVDDHLYGADANDAAGGVELCYGGGINIYEAYKRYIWVLAYSCYRYGLDPAIDIAGHHIIDPQRKVDPMNALRILGKTFQDFILDVIQEFKECIEVEDEDNMPMKLEHDWQWKQLGDALDTLYKKGLISDYSWVEKAYSRKLNNSELVWLNAIVITRHIESLNK